jgi:formate-dependent phosphoribosylglycinamide formyltransferase (GAR transformylase)
MKKSSSSARVNSVKNSLSVPNAFVTKDSAVVLATKEGSFPTFTGVAEAMSEPRTDIRILVNQRRVLTGYGCSACQKTE